MHTIRPKKLQSHSAVMLLVGVMMLLKTRAKFTWRYAMQWHTKNHETYKVVLFVLRLAEWLIPSFNGRTTSHFHKIMVCAVLINDSDAKMYEKWQFKWVFFCSCTTHHHTIHIQQLQSCRWKIIANWAFEMHASMHTIH